MDIIPYTSLYTPKVIIENTEINGFISAWKGYNFLRQSGITLQSELNDIHLSMLTSAKINKEYILYRGLSKNVVVNNSYTDEYPSSWSTTESVARRFGETVIQKTFSPESILLICKRIS